MNKKRVMELVTDVANAAYDEAYYHEGSERTDSLIKDIDEELNSKTVMPKVWSDWFETYNLPQDMVILELAKLYNGRIRDQLDVDLYNAIVSKDNILTVWDCLNAIHSECEPSNN